MPPMNVTYVENPTFAAPRAYWQSVAVGSIIGGSIARADNVVSVRVPFGATFLTTYLTLDPRFAPWSSNRWTLDHVLLDQVSYLDADPTPFYIAADVGYAPLPGRGRFAWVFVFPGYSFLYDVDLDPAPPAYWMAPPPP